MPYVYLLAAILSEVVGTLALKASDGFTRPGPGLLVVLGYGGAFYLLSLALRWLNVGTAYAIWAGLGIVLVALAGAWLFSERLDAPGLLGMGLIIAGIVVLQVFSRTGAG